jgi:hypothetical protein
MTQEQFTPDIEQIKQTSLKFQEVFKRMDAGIAILDDLIVQIDSDIRSSKLYQYRLNKAKRMLNIDVSGDNYLLELESRTKFNRETDA